MNTPPNAKTQRGAPGFAANQRDNILQLLRQAGPHGVSKEDLIFKHRMTQAAARVFELEEQGYCIRHESRPGEHLVVFVLESEPLELKPLPSGKDWYVEKFGKPRPGWQPRPFSEKRMAQDDCFVLTPPEPRP